ncbi:HEPN domain-containing protein [Brevundimonas sp. SL130]|uniref:HEPN domain-containing protein n=1 Tax=Brevundimonas sp. SL130 TaxID=2995143 RepID=UPI00226CBAB9|nr:HEPN domain-containing protein [Brevundimonas sp. SL130]WAC61218.1 HEPN domain-containing protein [Brevundimonas sp. SL130]
MIDGALLTNFQAQLDNLKQVVAESSARSIQDPPDALFYEHQNVFIKSYLVSACSMLEAFIQDLATAYVEEIEARIAAANLPHNLVVWHVEHEKGKLQFKPFAATKGKKEIAEMISPNYWKTIKAFETVGIDLSASNVITFKDLIVSKVEKRNKIVHHNDEALDLSFSDISDTIEKFREYMDCLFTAVCADPHIQP